MTGMRHQRRPAAGQTLIAALAFGLACSSVQAETIYRCDRADGGVVFSDSPCDAQAAPYRSDKPLSVVEAPNRLAERIAANQAFIDQRRQNLHQARQARAPDVPREDNRSPAPGPSQPWLQLPYWPPPLIEPPHPQPPAPRGQNDRFSALSGPFPGTVRRRNDSAANRDPQ